MRYSKTHILLSLFFPLSYFFNRGWLKLLNNLLSFALLLVLMLIFLEVGRAYSKWIDKVLSKFKFKGFVRMFGLCLIFSLLAIGRQLSINELQDRDYAGFSFEQGKLICQNSAFTGHCNKLASVKRYKEENYEQAFKIYQLICHAGHRESCNSAGWMTVIKFNRMEPFLDEALGMALKALHDDSNQENYHSTVAALYYLSKKQDKSIEHQTKAVELHAKAMVRKHYIQSICEARQKEYIKRLEQMKQGINITFLDTL